MSENYQHHPEYDQLPECIKHTITPKEHAWLGDENRKKLVEDYCNPDSEIFEND